MTFCTLYFLMGHRPCLNILLCIAFPLYPSAALTQHFVGAHVQVPLTAPVKSRDNGLGLDSGEKLKWLDAEKNLASCI